MQVDQPILDADPVQRLPGVAAVFGADPGLVVLDVPTLQLGTGVDLGIGLAQPGPELAEVVFDVFDRRGPQAQVDLGDVALGHIGESRWDRRPAGDRHGRSACGSGVVLQPAGMEQGELQPVEAGSQVASRVRHAASDVGIDDRRAGCLECCGVDLLRWRAGDRGDLGQGVPLQGDVTFFGVEQGAGLSAFLCKGLT